MNENNIDRITLVFENCEDVTIESENIGIFVITNIASCILRTSAHTIGKYTDCESVFIEISKRANKKYDFFGEESNETVFEHVRCAYDIASIYVHYNDNTEEQILVPWADGSDEVNLYQSSVISKAGNLYICIDKNNDVYQWVAHSDMPNLLELSENEYHPFSLYSV